MILELTVTATVAFLAGIIAARTLKADTDLLEKLHFDLEEKHEALVTLVKDLTQEIATDIGKLRAGRQLAEDELKKLEVRLVQLELKAGFTKR